MSLPKISECSQMMTKNFHKHRKTQRKWKIKKDLIWKLYWMKTESFEKAKNVCSICAARFLEVLHLVAVNLYRSQQSPPSLQLFKANQFIAHINPNCCFFSFCMNVFINPENSLQNSLSPGGVRFTTVAIQQQLLLASNFCELIEMSTRVQTKNSCDCCSATWIISTFQRWQGLQGTFGWVKQ